MPEPGPALRVRFWGVRGSFPTPNAATRRYGGNTPCVEVSCGRHLIIFDTGTGICQLGVSLLKEGALDADIMFSETRFNYMCGLPFFAHGYDTKNDIRAWAGHAGTIGSVQRDLTAMMTSPLFPIPLSFIGGLKSCHDFVAGERLEPKPGVTVRTAPLDHPFGATGYRVEHDGRSLCYISGTRHEPGKPNAAILALMADADAVIYDSFYADADYVADGASHSTWQESVRLCKTVGARRLIAFEHNPSHDDAYLYGVQAAIGDALPGSLVAAEGMNLDL
ncbi:MAG: MBL fold metallo-hydrolase [Alphaproteobacteria bacterium]|nr:MBL fold metallo-hydrolase [Alphaproteobacteria bacterium]